MDPLVELHVHLDGSLRLGTMLDIAREEGVTLPAEDEAGLYKALGCGTIRESLAVYLEAFGVTVSVMQSADALRRIAYELMEDLAHDGILYAEIRFMPSLHTKRGLDLHHVMEAVLGGLNAGGLKFGVEWGLIVCSMRHVDPEVTSELMDLAVYWHVLDPRVVAVDMAGDDNLDALEHAGYYLHARRSGLQVTVHAAESGPPLRAEEAHLLFGAERIGHAIRIGEDPRIERWVRHAGFPLEVCPTSNVQIGQASSIEEHPARKYFEDGHKITINTDNRTLADTTMRKELALVRKAWGLGDREVRWLIRNAINASFASEETKKVLHKALRHGS